MLNKDLIPRNMGNSVGKLQPKDTRPLYKRVPLIEVYKEYKNMGSPKDPVLSSYPVSRNFAIEHYGIHSKNIYLKKCFNEVCGNYTCVGGYSDYICILGYILSQNPLVYESSSAIDDTYIIGLTRQQYEFIFK